MGQGQSGPGGFPGSGNNGDGKQQEEKKKKWEPPAPPPRVGRKQRKRDAASLGSKIPTVTPTAKCNLRLLKLERVKDYLLMEEEFVTNQVLAPIPSDSSKEVHSRFVCVRNPCCPYLSPCTAPNLASVRLCTSAQNCTSAMFYSLLLFQ